MSDSVRPPRRQPTRLPHPWDSPGKNTGVGCHFLLQCMKVKSESEVTQSCLTLSEPMDPAAAAKLLQSCPTLCDPTDGSPPGSPIPGLLQARILEWVAIAFSIVAHINYNGYLPLLTVHRIMLALTSHTEGCLRKYNVFWIKYLITNMLLLSHFSRV